MVAVLSRLVASGEVKQETLQQAVDTYKLTEVSAASAGNTGGDS